MPTWAKVVLAILGAIVLVGLGVRHWWHTNQTRLDHLGEQMRAEGKSFGEKSDADGCINEALRRHDAASGFWERAVQRIFLKECLAMAPLPPSYCASMPKLEDMRASLRWATLECRRRQHGDQSCSAIMQAAQEVCWSAK